MAKIISFLFSCAVFVVPVVLGDEPYPPPELYEIIQPIHDVCTASIGVSEDEIKNYQISDNSPKMMCYMECLMKEIKWMNSDGEILYATIKEFVHPKIRELLLAALEKCMNIDKGSQKCELAYNFNVCIQKADPVHWLLV